MGRRCGGGRGEGIWVIEGALPGQETMRAIDRSLMQEKGNILFRYIQQILIYPPVPRAKASIAGRIIERN